MDEAEHCHRLSFIQSGEIIAYGYPNEIKRDVMQGEVLELAPSDPIKALHVLREAQHSKKIDFEQVELYGALIHIIANNMKRKKKSIIEILISEQIDPGQMSIIEPPLEDVFIASMRKNN